MKRVVFDLETNGLLKKLTKLHSLCLKDADTGKKLSCTDSNPDYPSIAEGLKILSEAEVIIGHNILGFDLPALMKLYPDQFNINPLHSKQRIIDTFVCARVIWSNIKDTDFKRREKNRDNGMPGNLIGRHGLEAWGYRLGLNKGDYAKEKAAELVAGGMPKALAKEEVWRNWSKEMQDYCELDVEVTHRLLQLIESKEYSEECIELEHLFQMVIHLLEEFGFPFDTVEAHKLYGELSARQFELEEELKTIHPGWEVRTPFTPKVTRKDLGYERGVPTEKVSHTPFKPSSRQHIGKFFIEKYDWKPKEFTEKSSLPTIDEEILKGLEYPEAEKFAELFALQKVLGFLGDGNNGWIKLVENDRIHGRINPAGTVTGRCAHSKPNLGNVPSCRAFYGKECRALFRAPEGYVMVGGDASGLELRCLAHYMAAYDKGEYAKLVSDPDVDIHTVNQEAAGLPSRDTAKTFIYGFLYGAGNAKIGSIVGGSSRKGGELKENFMSSLPALKKLKDRVLRKSNKFKFLTGLDGRHIPIRAAHASFNYLLQSAGAVLMKRATVILYYKLHEYGLQHGDDYAFVGHIHDEIQCIAKPEHAELVGETIVQSIIAAGNYYDFKCPLDGEYKIGKDWSETH